MVRGICLLVFGFGIAGCASSHSGGSQTGSVGNDGEYSGVLALRGYAGALGGIFWPVTATVSGGNGLGSILNPACGQTSYSMTISSGGEISGTARVFDNGCKETEVRVFGEVHGGSIQLTMGLHNGNGGSYVVLTRKGTGAG
jgi:hypothetical protein